MENREASWIHPGKGRVAGGGSLAGMRRGAKNFKMPFGMHSREITFCGELRVE